MGIYLQPDSFEVATSTWERVEKQSVPPICLLVGTTGAAGEPSCRQQAVQWCVGHGSELIEWDREPQPSQNGGGGDESEEGTLSLHIGCIMQLTLSISLLPLFLSPPSLPLSSFSPCSPLVLC